MAPRYMGGAFRADIGSIDFTRLRPLLLSTPQPGVSRATDWCMWCATRADPGGCTPNTTWRISRRGRQRSATSALPHQFTVCKGIGNPDWIRSEVAFAKRCGTCWFLDSVQIPLQRSVRRHRRAGECSAPGFLDSGLKVITSTLPRPARRNRVALGLDSDSRNSPASTARCTSVETRAR